MELPAGKAGLRIAMWSGPRNISTAMMRSFGNRPDTVVTDEPLYAPYLGITGVDHPGRDAVLAAHETDWRAVVARLGGPIPDGRSIWYQKHMAHHLLPEMDRGWIDSMVNCFLIRDPARVIASYAKVIHEPRLEDLGFVQQADLFALVRERTGGVPPVIDARDVLEDPPRVLRALCERIGVAFDESMLGWAPGPRDSDGAWAPFWYAGVEESTGFGAYLPAGTPVPDSLRPILERCLECYRLLWEHRITG